MNAGYVFYKHYYKDFRKTDWEEIVSREKHKDIELQTETINSIEKINQAFQKYTFTPCPTTIELGNTCFSLTTCNPGLLIGSGYSHEAGVENEYKIGFFFDHTSGLPVIPGSSIKGVLRSVFPRPYDSPERQERKKAYLSGILHDGGMDLHSLEAEIFEGISREDKRLPLPKRDIFFDAGIVKSNNSGKRIFDHDFITPHKEPLKNPIPLKFLKILPGVVFEFRFDLKDSSCISKDRKKQLFKTVLKDIGVGAKTNVGYGQLTDDTSTKG